MKLFLEIQLNRIIEQLIEESYNKYEIDVRKNIDRDKSKIDKKIIKIKGKKKEIIEEIKKIKEEIKIHKKKGSIKAVNSNNIKLAEKNKELKLVKQNLKKQKNHFKFLSEK